MSCANTCESNEIKYKGDGSQVLFTFPFTYIDETDVKVSLWDEPSRRWVDTTAWSFANATTIQFNTAPAAPDSEDINQFNIKIGRCTAIDTLAASFYPGSAIRAQDLNDNFEQLQLAIQEGRCIEAGTENPTQAFTATSDLGVLTLTPGGDVTNLPIATDTLAGLMSAADKAMFDGLVSTPGGVDAVIARNGITNNGTAGAPILDVDFGALPNGDTATAQVMPYDISALAELV